MRYFALVFALFLAVSHATTIDQASAPAVGPNINLTKAASNQYETSVAVNPKDNQQIFVVSRNEIGGLYTARSTDGGGTWITDLIGRSTIPQAGDIPRAYGNASVAWDDLGNLFLVYLSQGTNSASNFVTIAVSTDGGATFYAAMGVGPANILPNITPPRSGDQPTVAVGPGSAGYPGSVWVTYASYGGIWVSSAGVSGPGVVGMFNSRPPTASQPAGVSFGDIAVGVNGEAIVTYGPDSGTSGTLYVDVDADGLGPNDFSGAVPVVTVNIGGFTYVPAQPHWGIDPEAGLSVDRSNGPHRGRIYLAYTDAPAIGSADTNIELVFSDDLGLTWSVPVRANDDPGGNSQFLPHLALDQSTGQLAVTWYDARNSANNDTVQYFGAFSSDGGGSFGPNIQISTGISNQANSIAALGNVDFGDYTGSAFVNGVLIPAWADNSNSTLDNPDGATNFDVYTAIVHAPVQTYTLSLNAAGRGSGIVSGAGTYSAGQIATTVATANKGSLFNGWAGANAAECATGAVVMDAIKTCTAVFTRIHRRDRSDDLR